MSTERFKIINESVSYHCCFEYTIVDIQGTNDSDYKIEKYGYDFSTVCECFDLESAEQICSALNKVSQ